MVLCTERQHHHKSKRTATENEKEALGIEQELPSVVITVGLHEIVELCDATT